MRREAIFSARETKIGAFVVALSLLLFALGVSGASFVIGPDASSRPIMDASIAEARPLTAAQIGV